MQYFCVSYYQSVSYRTTFFPYDICIRKSEPPRLCTPSDMGLVDQGIKLSADTEVTSIIFFGQMRVWHRLYLSHYRTKLCITLNHRRNKKYQKISLALVILRSVSKRQSNILRISSRKKILRSLFKNVVTRYVILFIFNDNYILDDFIFIQSGSPGFDKPSK